MEAMDSICEENDSLTCTSPTAGGTADTTCSLANQVSPANDIMMSSTPPSSLSSRGTRIASYQQMRQYSLARTPVGYLSARSVSYDAGDAHGRCASGSTDSDVFSDSPSHRHMRYVTNYARRRGLKGKLPTSYR